MLNPVMLVSDCRQFDSQRQQVDAEHRAVEAFCKKPAGATDATAEIQHGVARPWGAVLGDHFGEQDEHAVHAEVVAVNVSLVEIARRVDDRDPHRRR